MSQPPDKYDRIFDFTDFSAMQPSAQQPGQKIDQELNAARVSINETIDRLNEIQRDDGKLRATAVDTSEFQGIVDTATATATAAATSAATSATTATTKAGEATASATTASNAATTATGASASAQAQATIASTSATTATTKATEASNSAAAALASQTSATASAATATTKAAEASGSAATAATQASNAANSANTSSAQANLATASAVAAGNSASTASAQAIAASNSASAASGSASSAASSASLATTKANAASSSASAAAASAASIMAIDPVEEAPTDGTQYVRKDGAWEGINVDVSGKRDLTDYDFTNVADEKLNVYGLTINPLAGTTIPYDSYLTDTNLRFSYDASDGGIQEGPQIFCEYTYASFAFKRQDWVNGDEGLEPTFQYGANFDATNGLKFINWNGTTQASTMQYGRTSITFPNASVQTIAFPGFNNAALTGTPTAVTQSAGNNTTALATTAFVQQEVPAASTTAAGKVELATNAEALTSTSTTLAVTPDDVPWAISNGNIQRLDFINNTAVSGSGSVTSSTAGYRQIFLTSAGSAGRASFAAGVVGSLTILPGLDNFRQLNFSKKMWLCGKFAANHASTTAGDAHNIFSVSLGGYSAATTGDMTVKGIGLKKVGGASSYIELVVHNGTSQSVVATTKAVGTAEVVEWMIYSDGTGNVTLYINGSQAATSSAGPTGATADAQGVYREQVEQTASAATRLVANCYSGQLIIER